jgi:hypothetical protein
MKRIRITIDAGVVEVSHVPPGVEVEVIDYDVEGIPTGQLHRYDGAWCRHWIQGEDANMTPRRDTPYS